MHFKSIVIIIVLVACSRSSFSQVNASDTAKTFGPAPDSVVKKGNEQIYNLKGQVLIYARPRAFGFLTHLPKDAAAIAVSPFQRKNLKHLGLVAASTALLILTDKAISENVIRVSQNLHIAGEEKYKDILNIKIGKTDISLLKAPKNINTALYQLGQGFTGLVIAAGLFSYGKIRKDYRSISTANQLAETFILMGVATQVIKRITGRESPSEAVDLKGAWHPFPSFKNYQNRTPYYDAFPSGHLATLMSTITILAENYPEKKWIKPIGYPVIGLVGYSMINNKVHWVSDYPLAIALGYLGARQVIKKHRRVVQTSVSGQRKTSLSYTLRYAHGRVIPGLVYKF